MIELSKCISSPAIRHLDSFYRDVVTGLSAPQKYLHSKYFYDATGDSIFQQIMGCPEYYLTSCEMEILSGQSSAIAEIISRFGRTFDVVELGPGDASKTMFLLRELVEQKIIHTYRPIDISANVIRRLDTILPMKVMGLNVKGLRGDYIDALRESGSDTAHNRLILFLGASIGNFTLEEASEFCIRIRQHLQPGDLFMIGFDLKKNPALILDAYNDEQGITRQFNLNLLTRINRELNGDFDTNEFEHRPTYDPITGACKSFLVSVKPQVVSLGNGIQFSFSAGESIYMEISQKYTVDQINSLAINSGFTPVMNFFDGKEWFVDALWQAQ